MLKINKFIFLIILFYFNAVSSISQTNESDLFNNIVQHKSPRSISPVEFNDFLGNTISLKDYHGKLVVLNFWATWCAPCKEEMPSLDLLYQNKNFNNLAVLPINMEKPNKVKTNKFFLNLNIKKLKIFFDSDLAFVTELKLRGVPTTVLINKNGKEFARILGTIDFNNKNFLNWLKKYD